MLAIFCWIGYICVVTCSSLGCIAVRDGHYHMCHTRLMDTLDGDAKTFFCHMVVHAWVAGSPAFHVSFKVPRLVTCTVCTVLVGRDGLEHV